MFTTSQTPSDCSFLLLPLELRDRIYAQLVSIKHTRMLKDADAALRSTTFYNWNVHPNIFRVNRQISEEAKAVMTRDNDFVVIERAKELKQGPKDAKEEDISIMLYSVTLWPGKATKKPVVPGERMRVMLKRAGAPKKAMYAHVMLAEELRDVCVGLSTFQGPKGEYRTSGLSCLIKVHPPPCTETLAARDIRERSILEPIQKLRHFQDVSIQGTLPAITCQITRQLKLPAFDRGLVLPTIDELISNGDQFSSSGDYDIATAHYQRAHEYFHHSASHEPHVFTDPADVSALEFKIMQHRALTWIEAGNFSDALEAAQIALYVANQLFRINSPMTTGPPTDRNGYTSARAFRKWTCECIKEGAARYGQRIKCEDIGRCYYYKSISEHVVLGDEATEQADNDKFTAIGCCVVSDTMKVNVPGELLQLDIRAMEQLPGRCGEDKEEGDEEWMDEEWETDEGADEESTCTKPL
ncbi:MAG: hypothetical protein Q9161_007241 [Pseudevernia consocians]